MKLKVKLLMLIVVSAFLLSACMPPASDIFEQSENGENLKDIELGLLDELCDESNLAQGSQGEGRGGEFEPMVLTAGEFAGQYNPADIRGSFTIEAISRYYNIPLSVVCEAFHIPEEEAANIQNKHFKYIYAGLEKSGKNVGNGSMIVFVSMYKRMPFNVHEPEYLLEPAADILKSLGTLSAEELDYLDKYVVSLDEAAPIPLDTFIPPADHDTDKQIYGRTTFGDLLDMGIPKDKIEAIINAAMPGNEVRVKDYCVQNNLAFSDYVRPELYELIYDLE